MPKAGAAAAQMVSGFQPKASIASYSIRAMRTLDVMKGKIMARVEELGSSAMFTAQAHDVKMKPEAGIDDAWIFHLGLKEVGNVAVLIEGDMVDVLGLPAVMEMMTEIGPEVAAKHNVIICDIGPVFKEGQPNVVDNTLVSVTVKVRQS
jgi:hypothetical protein